MTDLENLLDVARTCGITFWLEEGKLKYSAPSGAVTPELLTKLKEQKPALVEALGTVNGGSIGAEPSLIARGVEGKQPITFLQQTWVSRYGPETARDLHLVTGIRCRGIVKRPLLAASIQALARRHTALRAVFKWTDRDSAWMEINPESEIHISDLKVTPDSLKAVANQFASEVFDLENGPLFRVALANVLPNESVIVFVCHHAIADGWSLAIIFREIVDQYNAFATGNSYVPPRPMQFTDVLRFQIAWLRCESARKALAFWKRYLSEYSEPFILPRDRVTPVDTCVASPPLSGALPREKCKVVMELCNREAMPLSSVALAAFAIALAYWSRRAEVLTWVCHAGRRRAEVLNVVGCLFDVWLMRAIIDGNETAADTLRKIKSMIIEVAPTLDLPGVEMAGQMSPLRGSDLTMMTMFNFIPLPQSETSEMRAQTELVVHKDAIQAQVQELMPPRGHLDPNSRMVIILTAYGNDEALRWTVQHDPNYFDDRTVQGITAVFGEILCWIAENPDRRLADWESSSMPLPGLVS